MRWIRKSPCPGTVSTFIAAVNIQLSLLMILINFGYIKKRILQFIKKRVHKRERGACVSAEERSVYSLADSLACSWEFLKTWGRVVFFPSLDTQFTSMNRSRCTHTRTDCHTHTHTHNKNSHLPIIRFCYRLGKRLPQESPVCKWYKNFMYQKRGF